jgi:hypothetical protein
MHCKDGIDASLWPMAVNHAIHIYNNAPNKGFTPEDIFTGSTVPRHRLLDLHVWGSPVYVLDPPNATRKKAALLTSNIKKRNELGLESSTFQ